MKENHNAQTKLSDDAKKNKKKKREPKFKEKMDVSLKALPLLFFCAGLVCIVLRTLQTAKYIDPATGFYTGGKAAEIALYAILLLSGLIFCVMYFSAESQPDSAFIKPRIKQ